MFDIGFFELVLVAIVGLLVLGPERLPHAVRMTTAWIGKLRRSFIDIQEQIEKEVDAEDFRKQLQVELEKTGVNELKEELDASLSDIKNSVDDSAKLATRQADELVLEDSPERDDSAEPDNSPEPSKVDAGKGNENNDQSIAKKLKRNS